VARKKGRKSKAAIRRARASYKAAKKKYKPGEGGRFKAMKKLAAAGGARDPGAIAAAIGRRKYGKKRFQQMAAAGRKRK